MTKYVPLLITFLVVNVEMAISFNSSLLPDIKQNLQLEDKQLQLSISICLMALGVSGIFYGGFADRFGRRLLILSGLFFFSIGSFVSAMAESIEVLYLGRLFQGLGAGAGWIIGNACLKDLFHGQKYISVMNQVHAVAGIVPAVAPVLGAMIAERSGYRFCFLLTALFGLLSLVLKFKLLPETLKTKKNITFHSFVAAYRSLFKNREYLSYLGIKILCVSTMFVECANLPLIYVTNMGMDATVYSYYLGIAFMLYVAGSMLSVKASRRFSMDQLLGFGGFLILTGHLFVLFYSVVYGADPMIIQGLKSFSYLGWGFVFGNATAAIVSSVSHSPGQGSAMMISGEMLVSSIGISLVGLFFDGSILPVSIYGLLVGFVSVALVASLKAHHRKVRLASLC